VQYFVFKLLLSCAECGARFPLEGPTLHATCTTCHSQIELSPKNWQPIFELYRDAAQFSLTEGKTRGSALRDGELQLLVPWGPARLRCVGCGQPLPVETVPPGGDGNLACACGESVQTFPPPKWLADTVPEIVQLFGARREELGLLPRRDGTQLRPQQQREIEASKDTKPVLFSCPRCGAGLDIAAETPRILACRYCESDLYLPDPLWHACRPVKKRAPFWIAFRD
jgi:DNA-directed RNA polymerase subunit RPC12/RpoP